MSEHPIILRGSPGTERWRPPGAPYRGRPLASQIAVYVHVAGDADAEGDQLGLGAVLVARGGLVFHGLILVPDDLGVRDPAALAAIGRWAAAHPLDTAMGPAPWRVVTVAEWCDSWATREDTATHDAAPWAFTPNAYTGREPTIGADLGRAIGLLAEHVGRRTGANRGKWTAWLPGWGRDPDGDGWERRSPHRPPLRVESRRVGWSVRFGPCEEGFGVSRPGPFVDLLAGAYSIDADRSAGFVDHARHFGVTADPLPVTVTVGAKGAAQIADAVRSVHDVALAVGEECGRWFTTPQDRDAWNVRFPLARAVSPSAPADYLLRRFRVDPPLGRFALRPEEHAAWWEAFHGGWIDDDPALRGRGFGAVVLDVTSAYPLTAHLVGWWDVMTADRLVRRSVLRELRTLCDRAAKDPAAVLDPAVWERFGLTLCEVVPDGEVFPVSLDDPRRPDGRTETVPVTARGRTMFYSWCDVVAASILSGRVPRIVRAVRLAPEGRQDGLRQRVAVYPGLVIDAGSDPVLGLVARRRQAKAAGDKVLAAELHAVVNSLVSGNPSRLDDVRVKRGNRWRTEERAGPWTFAPIAVSVTAGARLLLAAVDRMARDLGGGVAYRDTDSSILPASPDSGTLALADGSSVRELSYPEVDRLLAAFDRLSPEPGAWPVWKRTPQPGSEPMRCTVFGPKRHAEYRGTDDVPELVEWTEAGLGGMWADPATMQGRCAEGGRAWSKVAVERAVRHAAAKVRAEQAGTRAFPDSVPWDDPDLSVPAFPTLRRLQVTSPELLATLPASLGAHLGTRFVEASSPIEPDASYVALDPGGPLDDWQDLRWLRRASGLPVAVTTTGADYGAVRLEPLRDRADAYGYPPKGERVESVTVTPLSVVYRGRVSPVLDASEDGLRGDLTRFRVRYENSHGLGPGQREALVALAGSMPSREFAALVKITPRIARRLARDQLPRRSTVERILRELRRNGAAWNVPGERTCSCGCGASLPAGRRAYVDDGHRERAKKRRTRSVKSPEPGDTGSAE